MDNAIHWSAFWSQKLTLSQPVSIIWTPPVPASSVKSNIETLRNSLYVAVNRNFLGYVILRKWLREG